MHDVTQWQAATDELRDISAFLSIVSTPTRDFILGKYDIDTLKPKSVSDNIT